MPSHTAAKRKANKLAARLRPTKKELLQELMEGPRRSKGKKRKPVTRIAKKAKNKGATFT